MTLHRYSTTVFNSTVEFVTWGPPASPFEALAARLRRLDDRFSRFKDNSELSVLNRANGRWVDISKRMHFLLQYGLNVAIASRGLVNIATLDELLRAGYVNSWPFTRSKADRSLGPAREVMPITSILDLQDSRARLAPGHSVDFGAIAKGVWSDEFADLLGANSICSLGGDLACRGEGQHGDGWAVGVTGGDVFYVKNGGVATSGIGKRRWGRNAHHLIDPRTGCPCRSDIAQATVIATDSGSADWMASAVVIGGSPVIELLASRAQMVEFRIERVDLADGRTQG